MKHLKTILFFAPVLAILNANAQLKKQAITGNVTSISSGAPSNPLGTKVPEKINTADRDSLSVGATNADKKMPAAEAGLASQSTNTESPFKAAVGVKFLWGISATGKYFFKDKHAIEAIFRYRSLGGIVNDITVTALYQYQRPIADVSGLYWMLGGGAYFGNSSIKNSILPAEYRDGTGSFYFGIAGVAGLEYKFDGMPIAISADWMPAINLNGGGFGSENGGIGIKYTF
ncbi:MAG: hypothetical protein REI64_01580 [Pedobacter sp.]|uniref:hypothetical protein n=1 Tax=Pedobacter sp. TaxID=1411316 RepID=UPI002808600D|nr:hypothetical protein [Pedobacter sp.]MDQ8003457.1 hypothetical protein [Pedobacter sp.]